LSNPDPEPPLPQEAVELDPKDPEVRQITEVTRQPTVEDVTDEDGLASASPLPTQPAASVSSNPQDQSDNPYDLLPSAANHHPSQPPLTSHTAVSPTTPAVNSRQGSIGGGYFPTSQDAAMTAPDPDTPTELPTPSLLPPPSAALSPPDDPQDFYTSQAPPAVPTAPSIPPKTPYAPPRAVPTPARKPAPPAQAQDGPFITDDEAVSAAQKHAKFAISALNFEDVPTAVKELRAALQILGAR